MKLPNGFGSITKLSGNRRRPYMIREGKSGKQKILGYASSREEALIFLTDFNKETWGIQEKSATVSQVYESWLSCKSKRLGKSSISRLKSAWRHCIKVKEMKYSQLKSFHMQNCIDECGLSYATQNAIKNLFYHLDRFCLEYDIISKGYATLLTTDSTPESEKRVFSNEETGLLWENLGIPWVDSILIFLYSGFRISELLEMKKSQVDLENRTFTGGKKTKAGRNRVVPIHSRIISLVKEKMETTGDALFSVDGKPCSITYFRNIWKDLMEYFQMSHCPHECRHTFRSWLDSAGANSVCIDRLMGHKSQGTGARVYTHKTIEELRWNLELVTI